MNTNTNIDNIIKSIGCATTRDEVKNAITDLKKKNLIVIAKYFNICIKSSDKIDMIIKKIIENTIGSKLRIEAIKSIDLHSNYNNR